MEQTVASGGSVRKHRRRLLVCWREVEARSCLCVLKTQTDVQYIFFIFRVAVAVSAGLCTWYPYSQDHATRRDAPAADADRKLAFDESLQMKSKVFHRDVFLRSGLHAEQAIRYVWSKRRGLGLKCAELLAGCLHRHI